MKYYFFYSEVFASGNHYRNMEANFARKTSLLLLETVFLAGEKTVFSICQIFLAVKKFFHQLERYLLMGPSFRLVGMDFLSSGKSFFFYSELC